jgi:hypothetical protein
MLVQVRTLCPDSKDIIRHVINLWPQIRQDGEIVFQMRHLNLHPTPTQSINGDPLSLYFSGTDDYAMLSDLYESSFGYYRFHFIVDTKNHRETTV